MGYYVEVPRNNGKQQQIVDLYGGTACSFEEAAKEVKSGDKAVIVIVNNTGMGFEAAAYAYNEREFIDFHDPDDRRPHSYVLLDKAKASELTGYIV